MGATLVAYGKDGVERQFGTGMGQAWFDEYNQIWAMKARRRSKLTWYGDTGWCIQSKPRSQSKIYHHCTFYPNELLLFKAYQADSSRWIDWSTLNGHPWKYIKVWW